MRHRRDRTLPVSCASSSDDAAPGSAVTDESGWRHAVHATERVDEVAEAVEADSETRIRDRIALPQPLDGGAEAHTDQVAMRRHARQFAKNPRKMERAHSSLARERDQ